MDTVTTHEADLLNRLIRTETLDFAEQVVRKVADEDGVTQEHLEALDEMLLEHERMEYDADEFATVLMERAAEAN